MSTVNGQSLSELTAERQSWITARQEVIAGKTFTLTTSNGSRTVSKQDLSDINRQIAMLSRAIEAIRSPGGFPFAVGTFNHPYGR